MSSIGVLISINRMFNGRNIIPNSPEELNKVVNFLNEKAIVGEFEFCDTPSYWAKHEEFIKPLGLGLEGAGYYFAVSLAFIAVKSDGNIVFAEKDHVWRWAWSFHLIAGIAGWKPDFMERVIKSFEGKEDNIDGPLSWAAQVYGNAYYDNSVALMSLLPQYRVSILAGLMENDFERYCTEYPPKDNVEEFAITLVKANKLNSDEVNKAFDIALNLPSFSSTASMTFFLSIHGKLNKDRKEKCEEVILDLLDGETTPYVAPMCNWMFMEQEVTAFEEECVLSLIKGLKGENNGLSLNAIDNAIGIHLKGPEILTKIFVCIAENHHPTDILRMEGCLRHLYEHKDDFQNMVLAFVMHPKGMYRIAGRRLWDEYHMESSDFKAEDLEESLQCFFVMSMLQDCGNPETRLPKILPLLKTGSEKVKAFIMHSIHPYVDEYMGHVSNAIDRLGLDCEEATTIKRYIDNRAEMIKMRRGMKELSPSFTDEMVFCEAMRQQQEHKQEQIKEAEARHKPAWHDFMATVILARGGGWRESDGTNRHLPVTSFSMPSRIMAESMSSKEQDEWINQLLKDWDDTTGNN